MSDASAGEGERPKLRKGMMAIHGPTRVLVDVLEVYDEGILARPSGSAATRRWSAALASDLRPVARDGWRAQELENPDRLRAWLEDDPGRALNVLARDELAAGEAGIRRRVIRVYLEDLVLPAEVDRLVDHLSKQLEVSEHFVRTGERSSLVFVPVGPEGPDERQVRELLASLGLPEDSGGDVDALVDGQMHRLASGAHEAAAALGKLLVHAGRLISEERRANILASITPRAGQPETWARFWPLTGAAQALVVRELEDLAVLGVLPWLSGTRPEVRPLALDMVVGSPWGREALASAPHAALEEDLVTVIDGAFPVDAQHLREPMIAAALARLAAPGVDLSTDGNPGRLASSLDALTLGQGVATLLLAVEMGADAGGVASVVRELAAPERPVVERLAALARPLYAAIAAGGTLQDVATRVPRELTRSVFLRWAAARSESSGLGKETILAGLTSADGEARTATVRRLNAHLRETFDVELAGELLNAMAQEWARRDHTARELAARVDDPKHARRVLGAVRDLQAKGFRDEIRDQVHREHADELAGVRRESAVTAAEFLSACDRVLADDRNPARAAVAPLRDRIIQVLGRRGWVPIGRVADAVEPDAALHEVSGRADGDPTVVRVGILDQSGADPVVVLKAQVLRVPARRGSR